MRPTPYVVVGKWANARVSGILRIFVAGLEIGDIEVHDRERPACPKVNEHVGRAGSARYVSLSRGPVGRNIHFLELDLQKPT